MSILELEGIGFQYGDKPLLQGITLAVDKGEMLGILGPNGAGKSTLLNLMDGTLAPCEGVVRLGGASPHTMKRREVARLLAVVPQEATWPFCLTVEEAVLMGRAPWLRRLSLESARDRAVVRAAMERVRILPLAGRLLEDLSAGERQRVLIARALAQEPQVLLLDEPTSSLDVAHQVRTFELMEELRRERDLAVVAVTHDINIAALYCDRIGLLREGRLCFLGPPGEVLTEANLRQVYGIDVAVDSDPLTGLPRVTLGGSRPPGQGSRWKAGAAPQL